MQDAYKRVKAVWYNLDLTYSRYARKMGINFTLLLILELLLESDTDYTQKALCEKLLLPKQLVNTLIKSLWEQKYVELREASDRRNKNIHLTPAGRAYAQSIIHPFDEAEEHAWRSFTDEEMVVFANAIEKYERVLAGYL